ncbi:pilus assembly protein CpaB [Pararobbsia alpina]|uniref:Flp pilus assembly protein CpaB n=1 Tax=Pararobbsia alpina TaxID=621374 RepID=UPI0039A6F01A
MSNIIKFALLIALALISALLVRVAVGSLTHSPTAAIKMVKIRTSAADLPQGLLLRDDDLTWKTVPPNQIPTNAIVEHAQGGADIKGALLRHPVAAGTSLTVDDVILPSAPGFLAATLKPDMRAISVAVDDVSGNAGLIQPGDYVDLLLTQNLDRRTDAPDLSVASETVVQHVRVLAVGSEIKRPKGDDSAPDINNRARTVTLEVTPRMGEVISVAARLGSLSLALRSFATVSRDPAAASSASAANASDASATPPVWAGDISRALHDLPKPHVQTESAPIVATSTVAIPRSVTIYRGSEQTDSLAPTGSSGGAGPNTVVPPLPGVQPSTGSR